MNFDSQTIDDIVKRVLAALPATASNADPRIENQLNPNLTTPTAPATNSIDSTVITEEVLKEHAANDSQLHILPNAIITPSGKDYLRSNNIQLMRTSRANSATIVDNNSSQQEWLALTHSPTDVLKTLLGNLNRDTGAIWRQELVDNQEVLTPRIISAICRGETSKVVAFTEQPYAVACSVNRNDRLRAAAINDMNQMHDAISQLQPNVLCIAAERKTYIELRNVVRHFTKFQ